MLSYYIPFLLCVFLFYNVDQDYRYVNTCTPTARLLGLNIFRFWANQGIYIIDFTIIFIFMKTSFRIEKVREFWNFGKVIFRVPL